MAVFVCWWTIAPAAAATDLIAVYKLAQVQDPVYATARAAWGAAQERVPQGRALLLPTVSATANTYYNDRDIEFRNNTSAPGRFNSNAYTVAVTQPIFRLQNHAQYAQSKLVAAQADAQVASAAQDLMLRVAQAYFEVVLMQDTLELAIAQRNVIGQQLGQAKLSFELGAAVSTDVHEAQARHDLSLSQEITARNELVVKRRALNAIIKTDPGELVGIGPEVRLEPPQPDNMQQWVDDALAKNPQIAAQRRALDVAMEEIDRNRYAHLPTVDAVVSYGRNSAGSGILGGVGYDITQTIVGIQVALPIYQGGALTSKTREAIANAERARQELETTSRQVALTVEQAYAGVSSGVAQVQALRAARMSTERQVNATGIGVKEGARNSIDLLNAQQQLFQARHDLVQAQYAYLMNRLRLKAASSGLEEGDLVVVNAMLGAAETVPVGATKSVSVVEPPAEVRREPLTGLRFSSELSNAPAAQSTPPWLSTPDTRPQATPR